MSRNGFLKGLASEARFFATFVGKFLRSPTRVASLVPSSRFLAQAMVEGIKLGPEDVIVEYGPGTGALTQAIEPLLKKPEQYLGIERDPDFYNILVTKHPNLKFHLGSAEDVGKILKEHFPKAKSLKPKVIISSLPFVTLPEPLVWSILKNSREVLSNDGKFVTFTYLHSLILPGGYRLRRALNQYFGDFAMSSLILGNVPPAYVIKARP